MVCGAFISARKLNNHQPITNKESLPNQQQPTTNHQPTTNKELWLKKPRK
jgi:hypothetical protein